MLTEPVSLLVLEKYKARWDISGAKRIFICILQDKKS